MSELSWNTIKRQVYEHAEGCCEYCRTVEANSGQTMHVDHINPFGNDDFENLCLACWNCNSSKHKATTAVDPVSNEMVSLYNPRLNQWSEHFQWIDYGIRVVGLTSIGRATVSRLKMNRASIVVARQRWVAGGFHPPE